MHLSSLTPEVGKCEVGGPRLRLDRQHAPELAAARVLRDDLARPRTFNGVRSVDDGESSVAEAACVGCGYVENAVPREDVGGLRRLINLVVS